MYPSLFAVFFRFPLFFYAFEMFYIWIFLFVFLVEYDGLFNGRWGGYIQFVIFRRRIDPLAEKKIWEDFSLNLHDLDDDSQDFVFDYQNHLLSVNSQHWAERRRVE